MPAQALSNIIGTRTAFTISLNSLANVTYVAATAVDLRTIIASVTAPLQIVLELELTPGTVSGNKQAKLFAQISMDNSNFSTGPTSGTSTTDEDDLYLIGLLPLKSNSVLQRKGFEVVSAIGFMPGAIKPVVFNDSGAALAASGNALNYTILYGDAR
jgi:hypothetical protein